VVQEGPVQVRRGETGVVRGFRAPPGASGVATRGARKARRARRIRRIARRVLNCPPVLQGLIALAMYLAVMLPTKLYPLLAHPSVPHLDAVGMDPNFFVWMLRWWPYSLAHLVDPLRTTLLTARGASTLAWTSSVPALAMLAAPLTETMGPVVSFNLLTVLAIPLAAWAAFVLCRRLTGRFWPSLVGGAVFGFSAFELGHSPAGQIDLTYSLMLPVIAYLVLLWWQGAIGAVRLVLLAGLAVAVQFYLFLETFGDMTALVAGSLLVGLLLAGRTFRPRVAQLGGLLVAAYGLACVLAAPYLYVALSDVPNILVSGTGLDPAFLEVYIPLFAVAVGLAVLRYSSRLCWFLVVMLAAIMVAALGPVLNFAGHPYGLPWGWVWGLPFLQDAYPNRLMVFAYLDLAAMTAVFLAGPAPGKWKGRQWARSLLEARWLLAGALVATLVVNAAALKYSVGETPHDEVPTFISSGQYRHVLSHGETVAVISNVGNAGMLWQAETDLYFRLAGGYLGYQFRGYGDLPAQIQRLSGHSRRNTARLVRTFERFLARARVGAVLVQVRYEPRWAKFLSDLYLRSYLVDGVRVYPTGFCSPCHIPGKSHAHRKRRPGDQA
jgi:hypothetical protein